jgi:hypothetical protein
MIWENCGSNFYLSISTLGNDFSKNDCIKAKLTADMTAIYFESHSRYGILSHPISQGLDVSPCGIIRYSHGCTLWNTMTQVVALSPVMRSTIYIFINFFSSMIFMYINLLNIELFFSM